MIHPATNYLLDDEPCFQLTEIDSVPPKGKVRRYRTYYVIRNDRLAQYVEDMGPSRNIVGEQCRILGGVRDPDTGRLFIEHTVSELRDIAFQLKLTQWDKAELAGVEKVNS